MLAPMFRKYQAVFTSRWKALWWAAGVCLTAYCTVPAADDAARDYGKHQPRHVNPWAVDKKN
jgi:hypothetical protein